MSIDFLVDSLTGDIRSGAGDVMLVDSGAEVAQRVRTRLRRNFTEWFLNTNAGMPWNSGILGSRDRAAVELRIQQEISSTDGVSSVVQFATAFNYQTRTLSVSATITTIYGGPPQQLAVEFTNG